MNVGRKDPGGAQARWSQRDPSDARMNTRYALIERSNAHTPPTVATAKGPPLKRRPSKLEPLHPPPPTTKSDVIESTPGGIKVEVPTDYYDFRELVLKHAEMNESLRRLARLSQALSAKPLSAVTPDEIRADHQIQADAERLVDRIEQVSSCLAEFPECVWELHESLTKHSELEAALIKLQANHAELFRKSQSGFGIEELKQYELKHTTDLELLERELSATVAEVQSAAEEYHAELSQGSAPNDATVKAMMEMSGKIDSLHLRDQCENILPPMGRLT